MEAVQTTIETPAAVQPIPQSTLHRCRGHQGTCVHSFVPGSGWVPDLITAYEQVRGTAVDKMSPLTRAELLSLELCYACAHDRNFERYGIKMYPTNVTLKLMERWTALRIELQQKEAELAKERKVIKARVFGKRLYGSAKPPKERSWVNFQPPQVGAFVNKTFEKSATPTVNKPNPKHRTHQHIPKPPKGGPKNYGDSKFVAGVLPGSKKKGKKNKKGSDDQKKRKGR